MHETKKEASRWHETYDNKISISHKRHSVSRLEIDTIHTRKISLSTFVEEQSLQKATE